METSSSPVNLPLRTSKTLIYWVIIVALLLYSIIVTIVLLFKPSSLNLTKTISTPDSNKLLTSQTAMFKGEITEADQSRIKIINSGGESGVVELSDNVAINDGTVLIGSASAQPKKIPLNKQVTIIMNVLDGGYKVVSINLDEPVAISPGVTIPTAASRAAEFVPPPSSLPGPIIIP